MRTCRGLLGIVFAAVLGTLAPLTEADAVELCFTTGGIDFRLEVMTIGTASATLAGGANFSFPGSYSRSVFGSAYLAPGGQARMGLVAPAGPLSVFFDLTLDPPNFNSGTGTLETVQPPGSASITLSPLGVCPTLN